jgi:hypothetical protein
MAKNIAKNLTQSFQDFFKASTLISFEKYTTIFSPFLKVSLTHDDHVHPPPPLIT